MLHIPIMKSMFAMGYLRAASGWCSCLSAVPAIALPVLLKVEELLNSDTGVQ